MPIRVRNRVIAEDQMHSRLELILEAMDVV